MNNYNELSERELDAAVAEKVMGHTLPETWGDPSVGPSHGDPGGYRTGVRPYLTDIAAAMQVVEKMRGLGWSFACTLYEGKLPYASFCKLTAASSKNAEADSLQRAICLAALATVKDEKETD